MIINISTDPTYGWGHINTNHLLQHRLWQSTQRHTPWPLDALLREFC